MKLWALTPLGKRAARSTRNPDTPAYRIIHCLDALGNATQDQIVSYTGLSSGQVGIALSKLSHTEPPLVGLAG